MLTTIQTGTLPIVDTATKDLLIKILGKEINTLYKSFLDHVPDELEDCGAAVEKQDLPAVARLAYLLRGTAGGMGLHAFPEACRQLELEAAGGDLQDVKTRLHITRQEFLRAKDYLLDELGRSAPGAP